MFVLKSDATVATMERALRTFNTEVSAARCEIHDHADSFKEGLRSWLADKPEDEVFLCIYAHMGKHGIAPHGKGVGGMIPWDNLIDILPKRINRLWLIGCFSEHIIPHLERRTPPPVKTLLVVTTSKAPFAALASEFKTQFTLAPLRANCEIRDELHQKLPELAQHTKFFWLENNAIEAICEEGQSSP